MCITNNQQAAARKGRQTMNTTTRWTTRLIAVCLSFAGFMHSAQATLVSTEQVAASEGVISATEQRAYVNSMLDRADVAQALQERGIALAQAKAKGQRASAGTGRRAGRSAKRWGPGG